MLARSIFARVACAGALALLATACEPRKGGAPPPPPPTLQADKRPAPPPAAPAVAAADAPMEPGDAEKGKPIYLSTCASCHGEKGNGDGPAGLALNPRPAKHSDPVFMGALSDEHLFKVVKNGGPSVGKSPLMAPFGGQLSDAQIRDVVAFMRTLSKK